MLFLGRAETMIAQPGAFTPIDLKRRLSAKVQNSGAARERYPSALGPEDADPATRPPASLQELALDSVPTPQITIDTTGNLVNANERARVLFDIAPADLGRPLRDLKISYRPADLRTLLDHVFAERRPASLKDIEWPSMVGESRWMDLHVVPLLAPRGRAILGASISFIDVSAAKRLQHELERANRELETAYEELQSTNEELETMNEELQSTNEELHTTNDELRVRSDDLNQANTFLESILSSLRGAVVVVDSEMKVLAWNPVAEEYWGLREDEVRSRNVLSLDIGLPTERLKQPLRACIQGTKDSVQLTLDAVNRRGRAMTCHVAVSPLVTRDNHTHGAILLMEEDGRPANQSDPNESGSKGAARGNGASRAKSAAGKVRAKRRG